MDWYEKFEILRIKLGGETVLQEITNYFSSDQINEFCDSVASNYDIEDELTY